MILSSQLSKFIRYLKSLYKVNLDINKLYSYWFSYKLLYYLEYFS